MRKERLNFIEEAELALETLMTEYKIATITEDGANTFLGAYMFLKIKWAVEFLVITFLFIFAGVFLWIWNPVNFEMHVLLRIMLDLGVFCTYRYIWATALDKKAVDTTKEFIGLANRHPDYFTKEETTDGNQGNADTE